MLAGTDCFQDRLMKQLISKGEDRGKPSLQRTRREDGHEAHKTTELCRRNVNNTDERHNPKGEDRGKPSPMGPIREDVPRVHNTLTIPKTREVVINVQKRKLKKDHELRNTELKELTQKDDGKASEERISTIESELERLRMILEKDPRNIAVRATLRSKQNKIDEDKLGGPQQLLVSGLFVVGGS